EANLPQSMGSSIHKAPNCINEDAFTTKVPADLKARAQPNS
ncbi:hypothetical protein RRG08_006455, partial [Elysia crispata]